MIPGNNILPHHSFSQPSGLFSGSTLLTGPSPAASPHLLVPSLVPFSLSASSPDTAPLKRDYPSVKFWHKRDWVQHTKDSNNSTDVTTQPVRGKTLMSKGINKNAKYIEGPDGEPVDGWRLKDIRTHARAIWASFQTVNRAPITWGRADAEVAHVYRREMRAKFPEFALCEHDWKADQLATEHYPSWYSNHVKGVDVKQEGSVTDSVLLAGSKRPYSAEPAVAQPRKLKKVAYISLSLNI